MIGHPRKAEAPQIRRGRQVHLAAPRLVHSAPPSPWAFSLPIANRRLATMAVGYRATADTSGTPAASIPRGFLFARTFREPTADFYSRAISHRYGRGMFYSPLHRETASLPPLRNAP